jgi:hypothetical protein
MERISGHPDWLLVGDSKLHRAENLARIHRAGGGVLAPIPRKGQVPLFLRTDRPTRGLLLIVPLGLRLLTLVEVGARRTLAAEGATLSGLYAGAPKKATARPTAKRLLAAFVGIPLYPVGIGPQLYRQLSQLTTLHERILKYLGLPLGRYTALATG